MLIFLVLIIIMAIGIFLCEEEEVAFILVLITGTLICIALVALPINHYSINAEIKQFQATKTTYENARKNLDVPDIVEKAAIQIDIAKQNRWLANARYWNSTILDIWIPDAVMDLKPLE